ncbi:MAG: hypothetical protein FD168_1811 [Desulfobulbaceae bacterium]|nr:MAG: hypothetical protein FD168_1811 [Desulfobulbaceae bacterium]
MKLRTLAEIATIIGVIVAILSFVKIEPNAIDKLPKEYKERAESDVNKTELLITPNDYKGEKEPIYLQYRAAISIDSKYSRDSAISTFVKCALAANDYKLAISAAKYMGSEYAKSSVLNSIVDQALTSKDNVGYAVIAAELIPSSYTKDSVLSKIVSFYEKGSVNGDEETQELTTLDKYKAIYTFADSSNDMDMSEKNAKLFADKWVKERDYESFLFFKEIYIFADSSNHMAMSEDDAKVFALNWIDNSFTKEDFKIFKEAYDFADNSNNMSLNSKEATVFAFNKMKEAKHANKATAPDRENAGGADAGSLGGAAGEK